MPLLPILLVAVVMAVDQGLRPLGASWGFNPYVVTTIALAPVGMIVSALVVFARICERTMSRPAAQAGSPPRRRRLRPFLAAERAVRTARWLIIANHVLAVLVFHWLGAVRSATGNLILVDEIVAILPPLLGLVGTWWAHFPIERRLREAVIMRQLDEGQPVYPVPTRFGYVLLQARLQLLLLLVPILLIAGLSELVDTNIHRLAGSESAEWVSHVCTLVFAAGVFIVSPLIARVVLDVQPMADGPLRQELIEICRRHRVRVRELLVWNTHGSMINAAVMGLVGPLRYVMITDALLESLRTDQVLAVMAHEVGHVRRHHMPWLVGCLMAALVIAVGLIEVPLRAIESAELITSQSMLDWLIMGAMIAQVLIGFTLFGWVCRRFERQADTFAVQHLSGMGGSTPLGDAAEQNQESRSQAVSQEAVHAMCGALGSIARLNTIDPKRPSWRHGSIEWRISYLLSIVGRSTSGLPIDRLIRVIKVATAVVLIGAFGYEGILAWKENRLHTKASAMRSEEDQAAAGRYDLQAAKP